MAGVSKGGGRRSRARGDRGAALVEFAIVAPLLFLVIFGIIEFGHAYFQKLDVQHGARETARIAAVNFGPSDPSCVAGGTGSCNDTRLAAMVTEACARMSADDDVVINIVRQDGPDSNLSNYDIGDSAIVLVEKPLEQITGFLAPFLNGIVLDSRVEIRLEQPAQWTEMPVGTPVSC